VIIAESKNLKIDLDVESNLPMVYADIGMIEKVIQNILDNAIKFTPEKGKILLKLRKVEQNVEVIISDSGHGIPEDELPHIFDRYHKIKRVKDSDHEGTGLGLAIVKKIVELHDSKIKVESEINEGTTFRFLLNSHNNPS
jgi:signal transduction histidine kinase